MPVKVKICGITNLGDALIATEAGADALGFVFYERSRRFIHPDIAATIIRGLPPYVIKTGVFVDAGAESVFQIARDCGLNLLQFHGKETSDFCRQFGMMSLKAIRISGPESLESCAAFQTDALLLDTATTGQIGGTGVTFDWDLAVQAHRFGRPIFLAGGLTPENVAEAVRRVQPFAVDVSSGVEAEPGRKDPEKVRAFIKAAKSV